MARTLIYTYQVTGRLGFPIDMLRHDQAFPNGSDDAIAISFWASLMSKGSAKTPIINLCGLCEPTEGRWESFGWRIISDSVRHQTL